MSAESEKIFGKKIDNYKRDEEIEFVKEASMEARDIFRRALLFLEDPGVLPHDKMQELAVVALAQLDEETADVIIHPEAELENAPIDTFSNGYARIMVPADYMKMANDNPTDILLHAVKTASFMRDLKAGWDGDRNLSETRAAIFQSEFLLWWEGAAPQLGIEYEVSPENEGILDTFPQGMQSPYADAYYTTLTAIVNPYQLTLGSLEGPMPGFDLLSTPHSN